MDLFITGQVRVNTIWGWDYTSFFGVTQVFMGKIGYLPARPFSVCYLLSHLECFTLRPTNGTFPYSPALYQHLEIFLEISICFASPFAICWLILKVQLVSCRYLCTADWLFILLHITYHISHIKYHKTYITYQVSYIIYHILFIMYYLSYIKYFHTYPQQWLIRCW